MTISAFGQHAFPALVPIGRSKAAFGWSRSTSYRLAEAGKITLRKVGAGTYVQSDSALAFIADAPQMVSRSAEEAA